MRRFVVATLPRFALCVTGTAVASRIQVGTHLVDQTTANSQVVSDDQYAGVAAEQDVLGGCEVRQRGARRNGPPYI
jgi:hypothetical protein